MTKNNEAEMHETTVQAAGARLHVRSSGPADAQAILLLHGWPHTSLLWRRLLRDLAGPYRLVAPDLRGLGDSEKADDGYDLHTLADDVVAVLDALDVSRAAVVGIDLGAPVAYMTAARHVERVSHLIVMESLLGRLPGAERFLAGGPPWWFGFHAVPDLPETVLAGHEGEYVDWFLCAGTHERRGVAPEARQAFVAAYSDPRGLHCGFEHYRALPANAELVDAAARTPLAQPVLAIGGDTVGDALARQLAPIAPDLTSRVFDRCGHIVPEDAPDRLMGELRTFLDRGAAPAR